VWQRFPYTLTIWTAGTGVDEYGNTIPSAFTGATARGDYQPVNVDETRDGLGQVGTDEVRFYFPSGTTLAKPDRVAVGGTLPPGSVPDGDVFEVIGDPDVRDPGSSLDYVRARGRRTA